MMGNLARAGYTMTVSETPLHRLPDGVELMPPVLNLLCFRPIARGLGRTR